VIGFLIKCMDKEYLNGKMVDVIWDNILMIKRKDWENFFGQMVENLKGNG